MTDGNKNVIGLLDGSGAITARYAYSPFGKLISAKGADVSACGFGFSSEYRDTESGLVYYNYRYLNPKLGRWMTRDPIRDLGGYNLYAFLLNTPISQNDYLGLSGDYQCNSEEAAAYDPDYGMSGVNNPNGLRRTNSCSASLSHHGRALDAAQYTPMGAICNSGLGLNNTHLTIKIQSTSDCCYKYRITCIYDYQAVVKQNASATKPNTSTAIRLPINMFGSPYVNYFAPSQKIGGVWQASLFKTGQRTRIIELAKGAEKILFDSWPVITAGTREQGSNKWVGAGFQETFGAHCEIEKIGTCDN